jgi:RTX calcium-binding nonapeptide repeat (4 copies)
VPPCAKIGRTAHVFRRGRRGPEKVGAPARRSGFRTTERVRSRQVLDGGAGDDILIGNAGDDVLLNGEVEIDE